MNKQKRFIIIIISLIEIFFLISTILNKMSYRHLHIHYFKLFIISILIMQLPILCLLFLKIKKAQLITKIVIVILIPISLISTSVYRLSLCSTTQDLTNYLTVDSEIKEEELLIFPDKALALNNKAKYYYMFKWDFAKEIDVFLELVLGKEDFEKEELRIKNNYDEAEIIENQNVREYRIYFFEWGKTLSGYVGVKFNNDGRVQYKVSHFR